MPLHPYDRMGTVTPSKPDYWSGTKDANSTFTREQTAVLKTKRGLMTSNQRRYDLPAVYEVRMRADPTRDQVIGSESVYPCPVVSSTKDRTRLCVIAPNGFETWVSWSRK